MTLRRNPVAEVQRFRSLPANRQVAFRFVGLPIIRVNVTRIADAGQEPSGRFREQVLLPGLKSGKHLPISPQHFTEGVRGVLVVQQPALTRNDLLEKASADVQYSVMCAHICPHGIVLFIVKRSNSNSNAKVFRLLQYPLALNPCVLQTEKISR